jgi:predicted Fe-Mo cluster-binding NifX family protein
VAFTTSGADLESRLDSRFGRAACFLIYNTDSRTFEIVDNQQNLNAAQGAGIQAAETVARERVACVVTGHCGPKAYRVLRAAGIQIFTTDVSTVSAALAAFESGSLEPMEAADVDGHWA